MKTVDVLTAARDMFANDPKSHTRHALVRKRHDDSGLCYCAIGAVALHTGALRRDALAVASDTTLAGLSIPTSGLLKEGIFAMGSFGTVNAPVPTKESRAMASAVRYLNLAAAEYNRRNPAVWGASFAAAACVNDHWGLSGTIEMFNTFAEAACVNDSWGLSGTIEMFNIAIKRARRRHPRGEGKAAKAAKALEMSVSRKTGK